MSHYDNTRNRFNPENRFIGDIEDGKRYPFGVYTKEECDEKFALKQTETDLATLTGTVTNLETAVNSKADEQECVDIRARLDALEYQPIKINSFSAAPPVNEMGSSQDIMLGWTLNKTATSQNINGVPVTGNSTQITGVTSSQTYTLSVSDGSTSASRSVSVSFANRIYYGAAADLTTVADLTSVLSNDPERTFTADAGAGEYIIYAIPARLGNVVFYVGGFEGGFEAPEAQTLANQSGFAEVYNVYRSTNANLGETTVEVREG